jgi:CRP/FNR family transcriptional regulator, cyclic AMP receptor protein
MNERTVPPAGFEAHKFQSIRRIDLFSGLSANELTLVTSMSRVVCKPRGAIIYMQEDPADSFYMIDRGRVKISLLSLHAKEIILEIVEPGGVFGELALVDDSPHVTMAEALDKVLLYVIERENFKSIMARHPELMPRVAKDIGLKFRKIEQKVSDLLNKDVSARITDLLVEIATTHSNGGTAPEEILVHLKQQDIAGLIGAGRQAATEALNNMEKMGWIKLGRGFIRIKSLDSLRSQQQK